MLTSIARFGHMMKVEITSARASLTTDFRQEGSIMAGTVRGRCLGVAIRLEITSPEPPEKVAVLLRHAENTCFVIQAVRHPVPVACTALLNGAPLPSS